MICSTDKRSYLPTADAVPSPKFFYRWKKAYGGMLPSEARELKQLREENARLKRVVPI